MYYKILATLFALSVFFNGYCYALDPVLNNIREPNFGDIVFIPGSCRLNYATGEVTDLGGSNTCVDGTKGVVGKYNIIANAERQVSIKILQRDNEGDNLLFIPEGELVSSFETIVITPNVAQQINSGATGVITINLGGRLYVNQFLTPSTNYTLTKIDGIEWSELP
jgi:hypothetical protein